MNGELAFELFISELAFVVVEEVSDLCRRDPFPSSAHGSTSLGVAILSKVEVSSFLVGRGAANEQFVALVLEQSVLQLDDLELLVVDLCLQELDPLVLPLHLVDQHADHEVLLVVVQVLLRGAELVDLLLQEVRDLVLSLVLLEQLFVGGSVEEVGDGRVFVLFLVADLLRVELVVLPESLGRGIEFVLQVFVDGLAVLHFPRLAHSECFLLVRSSL